MADNDNRFRFAAFAAKHEGTKTITILRRSWRRMSKRGLAGEIALDG